jgi:hypothetical protein
MQLCPHCREEFDETRKPSLLRHEWRFCITNPGRERGQLSIQRRKDGARRGWITRKQREKEMGTGDYYTGLPA